MDTAQAADLSTDVMRMIVRRPIFKRDRSVWGYELVSDKPWSSDGVGTGALKRLVSGQLEKLAALGVGPGDGKKLFLNIDSEDLLHNTWSRRWDQCVFGICGGAVCSQACSGFADRAHELGGSVALEADGPSGTAVMDKCDIIKVSLAGKTPADIVGIRKRYKEFSGKLLATDIPDWETFEGTKALGFHYFQGPFFVEPRIEKGAKLQPSMVSKLQLLRELGAPVCEMQELARIIASDVSLSYRILQYINSASFGLKNKIKSIQQAISLLGLDELKHWATVVTMTDLDSTPNGEELAYMALQRARFLSGLASTIKACRHTPETMFLLGLFSMLDALLDHPMEKALEGIPLANDLKEGLCGADNEYGDCLRMLAAVERGDWEIANGLLSRYGACVTKAATEYLKASRWAARQLPNMK
jgi:EAL and modified HD-GYP domain-containing signal transduction protein